VAAIHPIVSVGLDLPLLFTRAAVLRSAGYSVVTISPDTPSLEVLLRRQPPLVLICHTVKGGKLADVLRKANASKAPVLVLDRAGLDPEQLIALVSSAIASSAPAPPGSRGTGPRLAPQVLR
jgi:DNA-binding response OmpR family regulator